MVPFGLLTKTKLARKITTTGHVLCWCLPHPVPSTPRFIIVVVVVVVVVAVVVIVLDCCRLLFLDQLDATVILGKGTFSSVPAKFAFATCILKLIFNIHLYHYRPLKYVKGDS